MTAVILLGWMIVGAALGVGLDQVVRRAAAREVADHLPAGRRQPVAAGAVAGASDGASDDPAPDDPGSDDPAPAGGDDPAGADPSGPLDRHLHTARGPLLVPALAALGCVLVGLRFGLTAAGLPFLVLVPVLAELAIVDLHTRRLPNAVTLPALPVGLVLVLVTSVLLGRPTVLVAALVAAVLLFAVLLGLALLRPAGMGMGDVKVAAVIGLYVGSLGIGAAMASIVVASIAALTVNLLLIAIGRIGTRTATPFGPWLALGALVGVLAGSSIVSSYLQLVT